MTVLRIALVVGLATLLVGVVAIVDHRHKRDGGVRRAGGRLVLRARPSVGLHASSTRSPTRSAGSGASSPTGSRSSRSPPRRSGSTAVGLRRRRRLNPRPPPVPRKRATLPVGAPRDQPPGPSAQGVSWSTDVLWERPHSPGAPTYPPRRPGRPRTRLVREHAPPLRPRDRPGSKAGGAMRVRTPLCANPHSGAAKYCRCMCRMQRKSRGSTALRRISVPCAT